MTNSDLQNLILGDAQRIAEAIATGAGWEIWMQVELTLRLRAAGVQAAREVPYPPPYGNLTLDIIAQDTFGLYAIELKVESATNAGAAIIRGINEDRAKISHYPPPNPGARWVVGIAYSFAALQALYEFAADGRNMAIFAVAHSVGVLVATV